MSRHDFVVMARLLQVLEEEGQQRERIIDFQHGYTLSIDLAVGA